MPESTPKDANGKIIPTKIFVGNLPETCRRIDLLSAFEKFGKVVECDIVRNYAFVHFAEDNDARAAVAGLHETDFKGSKIKVELSNSRVRQKPGMGGKGECYRCGKEGHWSKECPKMPPSAGGGRPQSGRGRNNDRGQGFSDRGFQGRGYSDSGFSDRGFNDRGYSDRGFSSRGFQDSGFQERGYQDRGFQDRDFQDRGYMDRGFSQRDYGDRDIASRGWKESFMSFRERDTYSRDMGDSYRDRYSTSSSSGDRYKPYDMYDRGAGRYSERRSFSSRDSFMSGSGSASGGRDREPYGRPPPEYYNNRRSPPRESYFSDFRR